MTKNDDIDEYKCTGYGIGFDRHGFLSHPSGRTGKNLIIFRVDMGSSRKIDNRNKEILVLGKGTTQELEHTLSVEKMYSTNFVESDKKFCFSLHYNKANSYLFVNGKEIRKIKTKNVEIVATPSCLGNVSKDWSVDNMKNIGLNGYVYDFSVDYDAIAIADILDIHKYLMKKKWDKIIKFIKQIFISATMIFSCNVLNVNSLECVSMSNQECKVRPELLMLIVMNLHFILTVLK